MKKIILLSLVLISCGESYEEQLKRELKEQHKKTQMEADKLKAIEIQDSILKAVKKK